MIKVNGREKDAVQALFWLVIMLVLLNSLWGCSGSTGWRVSFGVSPVTAINDQATLKEKGK